MLTADFDFDLPEELIAQEAAPRGRSRMFTLDAQGDERHRSIADLPSILQPGDLLVVNNTRVIPARLYARRATGGRVELLLVEKRDERVWTVLSKPGRHARPGTTLELGSGPDEVLTVEILDTFDDGRRLARFSEPIEPHLARLGHVPLPPYIKRADEAEDQARYQTVYAAVPGAIAAPTAGLHFSPELIEAIGDAGIAIAELTLHVGIGTFKPVTAALVHEHRMEAERYDLPAATVEAIAEAKARGGRVVAVGTTVVRTLESAAAAAAGGALLAGSGRSRLFITPGYDFRVVDVLLTNFHLPASTLLMLVCAFGGQERLLAAYAEAVAARYRFYSYGDAMLLERRS